MPATQTQMRRTDRDDKLIATDALPPPTSPSPPPTRRGCGCSWVFWGLIPMLLVLGYLLWHEFIKK